MLTFKTQTQNNYCKGVKLVKNIHSTENKKKTHVQI